MFRNFKTSDKNRTNYIYYTAEGTKIVITPAEKEVTEEIITILHKMDDAEVDEQRRYDYRITAHLDGYCDGESEEASDRNQYLADDNYNPAVLFMQHEDDQEHQEMLDKLQEAMQQLQTQQKELFKKKYIDNRTNTDIAAEEGVTEAAIRNRLTKIQNKLKKFF